MSKLISSDSGTAKRNSGMTRSARKRIALREACASHPTQTPEEERAKAAAIRSTRRAREFRKNRWTIGDEYLLQRRRLGLRGPQWHPDFIVKLISDGPLSLSRGLRFILQFLDNVFRNGRTLGGEICLDIREFFPDEPGEALRHFLEHRHTGGVLPAWLCIELGLDEVPHIARHVGWPGDIEPQVVIDIDDGETVVTLASLRSTYERHMEAAARHGSELTSWLRDEYSGAVCCCSFACDRASCRCKCHGEPPPKSISVQV